MLRVLVRIQRKPGLIVNGPLANLKQHTLLKCVQDTARMLDKRILNLIKKYHNLENYRQKNGNNYLKYMNRASTLISPSLYQRLKIWPNNLRNIKMILTLMLIQLEPFISFLSRSYSESLEYTGINTSVFSCLKSGVHRHLLNFPYIKTTIHPRSKIQPIKYII